MENLDLINTDEIDLFNYYAELNEDPHRILIHEDPDHKKNQEKWNFPDCYKNMDVREYFIKKCNTEIERKRVHYEIDLYEERNLINLLKWAIWFMDHVNKNNLFIGAGRGSSVSSYCLFLIELHLVDSIKYELDPRDFLK